MGNIKKEVIIKDVANSFNICAEKLYRDLNPNIIKQVCKDLDITYKSLALELASKQIRVNCISPGMVMTEMSSKILDLVSEDGKNEIKKTIPVSGSQTGGGIACANDAKNTTSFTYGVHNSG